MTHAKPRIGDVVQIALPDGFYAYGRVLREFVAFYRELSAEANRPPIGSRDFQFIVGVYEDVLRRDEVPIVGHDALQGDEDGWAPPTSIRDPITGAMSIYERGTIRPSTPEETAGMEETAVWDLHHLVDRLMGLGDRGIKGRIE